MGSQPYVRKYLDSENMLTLFFSSLSNLLCEVWQ